MTSAATRPVTPSAARRRAVGGAGMGLALAAVTVATAGPAHAETYTVQRGDTVSHIALRTSTSVAQIIAANRLNQSAFIRVGQTLTIPRAAPAPAAPAAPAAPTAPTTSSYTVTAGDTVSHLAIRFGTTISAIVSANGLDSRAFIRIGQTLTIPGAAGAAKPAAVATSAPAPAATAPVAASYRVVSGDTVSRIASRFGSTVAAIVSANGLDSRAFIRIGQILTIPGTASAAPTSGLVGSTFLGRTYPAATVSSANQNKATLLAIGVPSTTEMKALVRSTAVSMGLDPSLAMAIAYQESGFNHTAVSPANAIGTMQVIPSSGAWASDLVGRQLNLLDPQDNVVAGVAILRRLVATSPNLSSAIAGYYQGQASVSRNGMFADTRVYVANVRTLMSRFA